MTLLDRLDAAIDGLCPCGALPAPGSAYCGDDCRPTHIGPHTSSETAMRWRPDLASAFNLHSPPSFGIDISPEQAAQIRAVLTAAGQQVQQALAGIAAVLQAATRDFRHFNEQVKRAQGLREQPPSDPMERALWLRKHRNTGPAPKRLDGRRRR